MTIPAGYRVDQIDLASASDDEVRDAARLRQELVREQRPEDPPTPVEIIAQQLRANPPGSWRATLLARDNAGTSAFNDHPPSMGYGRPRARPLGRRLTRNQHSRRRRSMQHPHQACLA